MVVRSVPERLTAQDLWGIWPERFGWPFDIGAIAILERGSLGEADDGILVDRVRDAIDSRIHLAPRFRQVIHDPGFGSGPRCWVDAASFTIEDHVNLMRLPAHADEGELLRTCERLHARRLDPTKPLWQMRLLPELYDHRVGLLLKLHHAVADGVTGVTNFASLLDLEPDPPGVAAPSWTPRPMPSRTDLIYDNLRRRADEVVSVVSGLAHIDRSLKHLRRGWPAFSEFFVGDPAPRTSLNRRIGSHRRLSIIRRSLDETKTVAHRRSAKVNDVLLAAISGGLRDLLVGRGETVEGVVLRAVVPVSLHHEAANDAANLDGAMVVPLPIGSPDPVERLNFIAVESAARKTKPRPAAGAIFRYGFLQRALLHLYPRQRWVNVYVANVAGPPMPLYLAGMWLTEVSPLVPILGNLTLGIGSLSYTGQFNVAVVSDPARCPDVDVFLGGVERSFDMLSKARTPEEMRREEVK